ncbi:MAG: hypothetical protein GY868_13940, partial [Deltaproteobacteria bacterium]|nr:hypothetical protein [Deltaproteobacteria bacterium]
VDDTGECTILRDETYSISINDLTVNEDAGTANFTVTLKDPKDSYAEIAVVPGDSVPIDYATENVTAMAGTDYTAADTTLTISEGNSTGIISIPIINYANPDADVEVTEQFNCNLTVNAGAIAINWYTIDDSQGVCTITDNDYSVLFTAGAGGTLSGEANQTANYETSTQAVEAIIDAANGYYFTGWAITGSGTWSDVNNSTLILGSVRSNMTAEASFSNIYTVTFSSGPNGSIDGESTQAVAWGSLSSAVTAIEDVGFLFDKWTGDVTTDQEDDNPLRVTVTDHMSVTAGFLGKTAEESTIPGCATATSEDYSGGFDLSVFVDM